MKIFCINGIALSGKDSFVNRCKAIKNAEWPDHSIANQERQPVKCISTIDPIKYEYKSFFGWNGEKTPEHRKNLNVLKQVWIQASNGPLVWTGRQIQACKKYTEMLFIMVREFDEMQNTIDLAKALEYKAYSLQIVREGIPIPPIEQEFLDSHPKDYHYNIVVQNPTADTFPDLPLLDKAVEAFLKVYGEE